MIKIVQLGLVFILFLVPFKNILAQDATVYTSTQALGLFKEGNYVEAEQAYRYLNKKYTREAKYDFYLGICQIKNRHDIPGAIKLLNYARIKGMGNNTYFYLGRAYQLTYHFEEALKNFTHFLKYASKSSEKIELVDKYMKQCNNAKDIALKIYNIEVVNKELTTKDSILDKYHPVKDVGKLHKNKDFFESGVDPDNILFETERGDVVYFSMATSEEDTMSIYKMEKLLDGWSESKLLKDPVYSIYNDAYPFLETDGVTFYFASDRPGGFGGYDIYRVFYDNETQSFMDPVNMGVPFNSPDDDFLFVSDEFNKVAWFASNRETHGDKFMVYTIVWDGNQVRSMAENENQISDMARLKISGEEEDYSGEVEAGGNSNGGSVGKRKTSDDSFQFYINDTIVYTSFDQFLDADARSDFQKGYKLEQQKDSLAAVLKAKRKDYSKLTNSEMQNKVVNEILQLENAVYGLDDQANEKYMYARQKELNEVMTQIKAGTYNAGNEEETSESEDMMLDGILIPNKFSMYTSDEFDRYYSEHKDMYEALFSRNDREILHEADSMYVWANILNLESAHILARSNGVEEHSSVNFSDLLKRNSKEDKEEGSVESLIKESKEMKLISIRLYHKAFDKKYPIFWLKLKDIAARYNKGEGDNIKELIYQGDAYFREAKKSMSIVGGLDIEEYEKAGTLKKAGVESQENALYLYLENNTEADLPSENDNSTGKVQKSYSELQNSEEDKTSEPVESVKTEENKPVEQKKQDQKGEEYRVQIGVFRNAPDPNALANLPEVTSLELEGRGLTKYFSGRYKTKKEAMEAIPDIIKAGFSGAYVVYFKDGKLTAMPK